MIGVIRPEQRLFNFPHPDFGFVRAVIGLLRTNCMCGLKGMACPNHLWGFVFLPPGDWPAVRFLYLERRREIAGNALP